jgi:hypothetical protein
MAKAATTSRSTSAAEKDAGQWWERLACFIGLGLVTIVVLALAAVHARPPNSKVDSTTVGLVAVAMAPWALLLVKLLFLPGRLEQGLARLQEQVEEGREQTAELLRGIEELKGLVRSPRQQ